MIQTICFISNFSKTEFFENVAKKLGPNFNIFWISVNRKIHKRLEGKYGCDNVLLINRESIRAENQLIGEYKLNELIYGDRILNRNPKEGVKYLQNIQEPIYKFLQTNKISFVFGEITWSHELLIHRIINDKLRGKCEFLNPHTVRIPNGRFAFFYDEFQSKFYTRASKLESTDKFKIQKPDYLSKNDKLRKQRTNFKGILSRGIGFLLNAHYDLTDPTRMNKTQTVIDFFREFYNRNSYNLFVNRESEMMDGQKFFLFTLHKQPEASIDVLGRYYEDQLCIIRNVWRILPNDYVLVVKEHTNALGDRKPLFYKELLRLNNVLLIDEKTDSRLLVKGATAVFTVSGTIAYEAALEGKWAFTFAESFFNGFGNCYRIGIDDLRYSKNFQNLKERIVQKNKSIEQLKMTVISNSFEGQLGDPVFNIDGMNDENIKKFSSALKAIVLN